MKSYLCSALVIVCFVWYRRFLDINLIDNLIVYLEKLHERCVASKVRLEILLCTHTAVDDVHVMMVLIIFTGSHYSSPHLFNQDQGRGEADQLYRCDEWSKEQ